MCNNFNSTQHRDLEHWHVQKIRGTAGGQQQAGSVTQTEAAASRYIRGQQWTTASRYIRGQQQTAAKLDTSNQPTQQHLKETTIEAVSQSTQPHSTLQQDTSTACSSNSTTAAVQQNQHLHRALLNHHQQISAPNGADRALS
ncbi:unnamed protein product [Amaranthus hypochondriacus]